MEDTTADDVAADDGSAAEAEQHGDTIVAVACPRCESPIEGQPCSCWFCGFSLVGIDLRPMPVPEPVEYSPELYLEMAYGPMDASHSRMAYNLAAVLAVVFLLSLIGLAISIDIDSHMRQSDQDTSDPVHDPDLSPSSAPAPAPSLAPQSLRQGLEPSNSSGPEPGPRLGQEPLSETPAISSLPSPTPPRTIVQFESSGDSFSVGTYEHSMWRCNEAKDVVPHYTSNPVRTVTNDCGEMALEKGTYNKLPWGK